MGDSNVKLLIKKKEILANLMSYKLSYNIINKTLFQRVASSNFEKMQRLITDHKIIKSTTNFLSSAMAYLNRTYPNQLANFKIVNKTSRTFLTYLLLLYHEKQVLGDVNETNTLEKNMISQAKLLHITLNNIHKKTISKGCICLFLYQLKQYINAFNKWKDEDSEAMVENLTRNYWELELVARQDFSSQEGDGVAIVAMMRTEQERLLKYIRDIGGEEGIRQFKEYVPIAFTDDFMENIKDTLEVAYWDMYRDELYGPKEHRSSDKLRSVMLELSSLISELISQDNQNNLGEYFNVEYICDMIHMDTYQITDLKKMWDYLLNLLMTLDSPDNDSDNKFANAEMYKILNELCERDLPLVNKVGEGWIHIFRFMIPKIQSIIRIKEFIMNGLMEDGNIDMNGFGGMDIDK